MKHVGENVVRIEAEALRALADRIAGPMAQDFQQALDLMLACAGRVVVTGMGKSGLIARKIAATLTSTGTPSLYLHPVEALHGDLGMIVRGDVVLALSASGETEEILQLLATIKRLQVRLIAMTCDENAGDRPIRPRWLRHRDGKPRPADGRTEKHVRPEDRRLQRVEIAHERMRHDLVGRGAALQNLFARQSHTCRGKSCGADRARS